MPTARQSAKSMFSIGLNIPPEAIAHVLMETRSHAALPPMTHQLRFQVWVKGITPLSSSTTSFPISRRAISPTDSLNAPVSEAAPDLSPRNSAPAPLCLSGLQGSYINCEVTLTVNGKSKTFVPKAICNGKVSDGIYVRPRIG